MQNIVFEQDPSLSYDTLILNETRLIIATRMMGTSKEQEFRLKDLSADYEQTGKRFWHLYITPLLFSVAMPLLAWWLFKEKSEFGIVAAIAAVLFFWHTVQGFQPVETAVFSSRDGKKIVEIYRPRKTTLAKGAKSKNIYESTERLIDYHEFVTALRDRIKANATNARPEQSK